MCGIAGIISFDRGATVDAERLRRMRDVLRHRGPDGEGLWTEGPVGLAHRRLSILDIEGGAQPMTTADENAWIVFNGEIYNHPELKPQLEARGHRYRTRSDTETILHIYEDEGEACVERLQGMFAFALWDRQRQQLLLARDRLGIKPLYYAMSDHELLFASEIKAILAAGSLQPRLNEHVVPEYLATGFVSGPETFFQGIRKLLPGRTLTWSRRDRLRERRYWQVPASKSEPSSQSLKAQSAELRARLTDTVRSHLMSDVPVGLFLSGGIDSTGLAGLMASMVKDPIQTFSVGFPDREGNELDYARLAARSIRSEHHEVVITAEQFFRELPRLVWHEDEPIAFPSSVPLYFVSALAREHVKVVLTGEGADELFGGYNRYRVTALNQRLGEAYSHVLPRFARERVSRAITSLPWKARRYLGRTFLALSPDPRSVFFENFAVFGERARDRLLQDQPALRSSDPFAEMMRCYEASDGGILDRMTQTDMQTYLVELLMKQDQMSMAASVESRVPYLDHQLVEYVVGLPAESKVRGWQTKLILREALRDLLPAKIITRRKMGFPVPVGSWLRSSFGAIVEEFVTGPRATARNLFDREFVRGIADEHRSRRGEHGTRLWLLMNLEIWQRIFLDGEDAESIMGRFAGRAVAA
ncbi:MAG TPA: asparagine synthase (glutamine-hydrolyzing) [Thermoanaerobaculia bacterium]|nr:asparagine synthase (glutamine-hydrolyzing) [Thermoanaerobaculia bacterium]